MTELEKIRRLVEFQSLLNRELEINELYGEEERKQKKLQADNNSLGQAYADVDVNYREMDKKVNEEMGRRDEINARINSLNEGKDKIKIARQLKSWEKEMTRMQQELSLIQAQIEYDSSKRTEMNNELERISAKINDNKAKIDELQNHINEIKANHSGELQDIENRFAELREEFDVEFIDYFESMLIKTFGKAIVEIDEDSCSGCNIELPTYLQGNIGPNISVELIKLYQCPHCFRYLYYSEWLEY